MILSKCTSSECGKKFTEHDIVLLEDGGKKFSQNCPYCDHKVVSNITEKYERKKWYGYLNQERTIVEHLVLVVTDQFEDCSTEVEIPLLKRHLSRSDCLSGLQAAAEAIDDYLMKKYGLSYENDRQFITAAFRGETELIRHQVPVWW